MPVQRPLTKSRFRLAQECPTKLYYLDRPKEYANDKLEDPFLRNLAAGGFQVGALARLYFPGGHEVATLDYERSLAETASLLEKDIVTIYEAAFRYGNLFIRADIVRKEGDVLYLYEAKAKSYHPDDDDFWQKRNDDRLDAKWKEKLYDVAFQHHVIRGQYPDWRVVPHLLLANKKAVATVDGLNQRFRLVSNNGRQRVVVDPALDPAALGERILIPVEVTREVAAIQAGTPNGSEPPDWPPTHTFASWVAFLAEQYEKDVLLPPRVSKRCKECEFRVEKSGHPAGMKSGFEECWTKALALRPGEIERRIPIFEIWRLLSPQLLDQGVHFIDELHEADFHPKTRPKEAPEPGLTTAERKALQWKRTIERSGEAYFDARNFAAEIADYVYPLHFIDFETSMVAIPFNKGRRPYEEIAFQFSHHTLAADGTIAHAGQWIGTEAGKFPNFDFVRALKRELEKDGGTIFRYAAHENSVLNHVREQLAASSTSDVPDRDALMRWIETIATPSGRAGKGAWQPTRPMVDMLDLVQRFFWHPRMRGSNSIKVVLPAILECSTYLQKKYAEPIYGAPNGIRSLNYDSYSWIRPGTDGKPQDPYRLLPPVFDKWDRNTLDRLYGDEELADGGAAMMAYAKLQFSEMTEAERRDVTGALLRYCELDTLAMVMLWEGWTHWPR